MKNCRLDCVEIGTRHADLGRGRPKSMRMQQRQPAWQHTVARISQIVLDLRSPISGIPNDP